MALRVPLASARARWAAVVVVAAAILYLMVVGSPVRGFPDERPLGLVGFDKWLHALDYAVLTLALAYALADGRRPVRRTLAVAVAVSIGYGAGLETLQLALPDRWFDPADAAANAVGALLVAGGWWLAIPWVRFVPSRRSHGRVRSPER